LFVRFKFQRTKTGGISGIVNIILERCLIKNTGIFVSNFRKMN
jgi:hypothetical protein